MRMDAPPTIERVEPVAPVPRRPSQLGFGVASFVFGVGSMAAFALWQARLPFVEATASTGSRLTGFAVDFALIASFSVVHSLLAREGIRRRVLFGIVGALERSFYTCLAALQIVALIVLWRPLPGLVWEVGSETVRALLWTFHALGWLVAVAGFHAAGATHLFGLAQARASAARRPYDTPALVTSGLYGWIRHPLYAGTLVALWSVPTMTRGRLLLAAALTVYIAIGARLEERDLARRHGDGYRSYRERVPGYVSIGTRGSVSRSERA